MTLHHAGRWIQTAFITDDMEASMSEFTRTLGAGPWFLRERGVFPNQVFRGTPSTTALSIALGYAGDMQIELIEPDLSIPSIYTEFLNAGGTGVHHVCYWCNLDTARSHFGAAGSAEVQGGIARGLEFLYMEGFAGFPYIEFIDPDAERVARFKKIADAAVDWDGSEPIRGRA